MATAAFPALALISVAALSGIGKLAVKRIYQGNIFVLDISEQGTQIHKIGVWLMEVDDIGVENVHELQ